MICIIALVVFGVLGIFSATHRVIAKEAFDCVFRRLTLRKCTTGLDKRLKAQITGKVMKKRPKIGRFLYHHFELLSWIFTILLVLSVVQVGISGYNFVKYGNCNGEDSSEFCIFDPLNRFGNVDVPSDSDMCVVGVDTGDELTPPPIIGNEPFFGDPNAKVQIISYGCFSCPNTMKTSPTLKQLYSDEDIGFTFMTFPLPNHELSMEIAIASACLWEYDQENYWDGFFQMLERHDMEFIRSLSQAEGYADCIDSNETRPVVQTMMNRGYDSNVYGTPTFFVNEEPHVGYISYKDLRKIIEKYK